MDERESTKSKLEKIIREESLYERFILPGKTEEERKRIFEGVSRNIVHYHSISKGSLKHYACRAFENEAKRYGGHIESKPAEYTDNSLDRKDIWG